MVIFCAFRLPTVVVFAKVGVFRGQKLEVIDKRAARGPGNKLICNLFLTEAQSAQSKKTVFRVFPCIPWAKK
jgi:hypothetical protein